MVLEPARAQGHAAPLFRGFASRRRDGLARMDLGAYERINAGLVPGDVPNLRWSNKTVVTWGTEPTAVEYHVYRDTLPTLRYGHFATCQDGLDNNRTDLTFSDPQLPASGQGFSYLITAEDGAGNEGTLGLARCAERSNFIPCP